MVAGCVRDKRHGGKAAAGPGFFAIWWGEPTIQQALADKFKKDHQRKFEYAFVGRCLARDDVVKRIIVDFGGGRNSFSTVVPLLFRFPGTEIVSVDISHHNEISEFGVRYVQADCRSTGLGSTLENKKSVQSSIRA